MVGREQPTVLRLLSAFPIGDSFAARRDENRERKDNNTHLPPMLAGTNLPTLANTAAATSALCRVILPLSRWAISDVCLWKLRSNPWPSPYRIQAAHSRGLSRPSMLVGRSCCCRVGRHHEWRKSTSRILPESTHSLQMKSCERSCSSDVRGAAVGKMLTVPRGCWAEGYGGTGAIVACSLVSH